MELLNSNNFLHWRENMHLHLLEQFGSLGHVVVNDNYIVPNIDNLQESSVTTTVNGVTTTIRSDLIKAQNGTKIQEYNQYIKDAGKAFATIISMMELPTKDLITNSEGYQLALNTNDIKSLMQIIFREIGPSSTDKASGVYILNQIYHKTLNSAPTTPTQWKDLIYPYSFRAIANYAYLTVNPIPLK